MKIWTIIVAVIAIGLVSMFLIPPKIRCKFYIWDKDACAKQVGATELLGADPNMPVITQFDELAAGFQQ